SAAASGASCLRGHNPSNGGSLSAREGPVPSLRIPQDHLVTRLAPHMRFRRSPMQHVWLAIILAVGPADASAQAQPVGAIAALVGQGTVIHAAGVGRARAKIRDEIFVRDRIETAEQSVIRVLMGGRITVTIRERSIVTITDDPMRSRVDLQSGKLAFKVHEGGLRAGEVAEILTPNAVTAIRGSLVIAQVTGDDSDVTVLEAHKPITIAPPANPTPTTRLPIGHTVRVSGPRHAARLGQLRRA